MYNAICGDKTLLSYFAEIGNYLISIPPKGFFLNRESELFHLSTLISGIITNGNSLPPVVSLSIMPTRFPSVHFARLTSRAHPTSVSSTQRQGESPVVRSRVRVRLNRVLNRATAFENRDSVTASSSYCFRCKTRIRQQRTSTSVSDRLNE